MKSLRSSQTSQLWIIHVEPYSVTVYCTLPPLPNCYLYFPLLSSSCSSSSSFLSSSSLLLPHYTCTLPLTPPTPPTFPLLFFFLRTDFGKMVAKEYLTFFEFDNTPLDEALRQFLSTFTLTGETQERERVMEHFSQRYFECNPSTTYQSFGMYLLHVQCVHVHVRIITYIKCTCIIYYYTRGSSG